MNQNEAFIYFCGTAALIITIGFTVLALGGEIEKLLIGQISQRLQAIENRQKETNNRLIHIMKTIVDIQAEVTAETTVVQSTVTLLGNLSQQLKDALAANDQTAIQAVIDGIDANKAALAAAVTANTPAAPATEPAPVAPPTT